MADTTPQFVAESAVSSHADNWLRPRWFAAILGLFVFASFPQVIAGLQTFVYRDFGYFGYPLAHHLRESFWRGEIPLWNPLNNCGLPFLAQWNTQCLYPPAMFYVLFPLSWSLGVFCLFHMWLGGMGMFFLAERWTGNRLSAAFAGIVFAFNGLMLNCLMWPNNIAALGLMPWVVLLMEKSWRDGGRKIVTAAFVGALQMLAGGPEIILLTWVLVGALFVTEFFRGEQARQKILLRVTSAGILVAGICAAQLLPFLHLLAHSHRDGSFSTSSWSMPLMGFANFIMPLFHAHPSFHGVYLQSGQQWTSSYYAGAATVALAIFAVFKVRHWRVWLLAAAAIFCLVLALGDAGLIYGWLRKHIPAFGFMRFPIKFVVVPIFILPLLAAYGVARIQANTNAKKLPAAIFFLCIAALGFFVWWEWKHPLTGDDWDATWHNAIFRAAFFAATIFLLFASRKIIQNKKRVIFQLILFGLVWSDLVTHAPLQKTVSRGIFEPNTARDFSPRHGESRAMVSPAAAAELQHSWLEKPESDYQSRRQALVWNCNLLDGIPVFDGFYSLYIPAEMKVADKLFREPGEPPRGLLDFLGVAMISSTNGLFDWERRVTSLPLLTGGQKILFADEQQTLTALVSGGFNPREQVLLSNEAASNISKNEAALVKISETIFSANKIEARFEADKPSIIVAAQTFYPNWKAYVDGKPATLIRANHAFQAVQVLAGGHQLKLVYEDRMFSIGSAISLISLALCGAAWLKFRPLKNV